MQSPNNLCGTCTACCRVFSIPQMNKPAGKWCQHCDIGHGCKIYNKRPPVCSDFTCLWLESHHRGTGMPLHLRPDHCKIVFSATTNPTIIAGVAMTGNVWRKNSIQEVIKGLISLGLRVVVGTPMSTTKTMIDKFGEHQVEMTKPDRNGMQWSKGP